MSISLSRELQSGGDDKEANSHYSVLSIEKDKCNNSRATIRSTNSLINP